MTVHRPAQTHGPTQRDALLAAGVDPERIYHGLASGRHDARPGLAAYLKALQPSNTLVLWKLDRLGRDLKHSSTRPSICACAAWA